MYRDEGSSNINVWKKKIPGWENNMYKCLGVGVCLAHIDIKEVSVAGMK